MVIWKRCLLSTYYHATIPYRRHAMRRLVAAGRAPLMVLIHHRVADDRANDWTTSTDSFIRQIRWLKQRYDLVSLAEIQSRIRARSSVRPAVSITFDDGYADNLRTAMPLLIDEGIPCTYFVTTHNVLDGVPFPHDLKMGNRLEPNTISQLRELTAAGVEIGAHTRTHPDVGRIGDPHILYDEVVAARDDLQQALGSPVRFFAFPFGLHANLNAEAFHLARQHGFEAVTSAYGGVNFPGDDPFHIQRIGIDDPAIRMKNYVTCDPRKRHVPRFVYEPALAPALLTPVEAR